MACHHYEISALAPQTSFDGETSGGVKKCQLFSLIEMLTSRLLFIDDTSASTSDDHFPLLWILVAATGVLLFVMVLLILVIYKKNRNAAFSVEKEVK